jgi:shikimate dehydrogenase
MGTVVLFGAGGAGSALAHALRRLGVEDLVIVDPERERARTLARAIGGRVGEPEDLADADGLVHATPTGMEGHPGIALDPGLLHEELWVTDIVYRPLETELLRAARTRGCRTLDGGGMVVFQAAASLELFTGLRPERERMLRHFAELTE